MSPVRLARGRPAWPALLLLLVVVVLGAWARRLEVTGDLAAILPDRGELAEALRTVERFGTADLLLVEVDGRDATPAELREVVFALGRELEADPAWRRVRYRVDLDEGRAIREVVARQPVDLVPEEILRQRLSPEGMRAALRARLARLAGPMGAWTARRFTEDPLDLVGLALDQVRADEGGFRVQVRGGLLTDVTGQRAILVIEPARSALGEETGAWMDRLQARLAALPLPARAFGGPRVAVEAARDVRRDAHRSAAFGMVGVVLLLLMGFRSVRPLAGALAPLTAAAAAAGAVAAHRSPVHGIELGFVGALLGLSVDYWLHLYTAASLEPGASGGPRERLVAALRARGRLLPPLLLSAGSTAVAFLLLTTSETPVVATLGALGLAAVGGALAGTLWFGPWAFAFLGGRRPRLAGARRPSGWGALAALLLLLVAAVGAMGGTFDGDPRHLVPMRPGTAALEAELVGRYGGFGTGGLVVIEGEDLPALLDRVDELDARLGTIGGVTVVGTGRVLPGPAARARRHALLADRAALEQRLAEAAAAVGFRPEAVAGALERLPPPAEPDPAAWSGTALEERIGRHLQSAGGRWRAQLTLVLADEALEPVVEAAVAGRGVRLVLPGRLADRGVTAIRRELVRLTGAALLLVFGMLLVRLRSVRRLVAALAPLAGGMAGGAAATAWAGVPWNAVSVCGMILVLGLALDYGVFVVEEDAHPGTRHAVRMSAGTTLAGFGGLAFAGAPALSGLGWVVVGGLAGALVMALLFSPALLDGRRFPRRLLGGLAFAALVLVHLDLLVALSFPIRPPPPGPPPPFEVEGSPEDRRFGPSRLVRTQGIWALRVVGDPYARGRALGALTPELRDRLEDETLRSFREHVPLLLGRYLIVRGAMLAARGLDAHVRAEDLLELRGLEDATPDPHPWLGHDFTRKLYYHALHDIGQALVDSPFVHACTGFVAGPPATADGHWILARNFDFDGGEVFDRDKVVSFVVPDEGIPYATVSFAGMLGVVSGLNAEGIGLAIQAAGSDDPIRLGTPMTLIVREALQTAHDLEEVRSVLEARRGFVAEIVLAVDGKAGEAAIFEVSPERVARLDLGPEGWLAASNHFRSPAFAGDRETARRLAERTTGPRLARMEELLRAHAGRLDAREAVSLLRDRSGEGGRPLPRGHRWAIDADIATHSVVLDATAGRILVSRFPNTAGGYVAFDLADGLAGRLEGREVLPPAGVAATLAVHRARRLLSEARGAPPRRAEALAREALEAMPGHPRALAVLGQALAQQGRREEALEALRAAAAVPPAYGDLRREVAERIAELSP